MTDLPSQPGIGSSAELSEAITALSDAEKTVSKLTAGEIDAVLDSEGGAFMLQRSQEQLRTSTAVKQAAILDALPARIALVDVRGVIVSVNLAWRLFDEANGLNLPDAGIGSNYLEISDCVNDGSQMALEVAAGLRAVLGDQQALYSVEYPCHSPTSQHWFLLTITPLSAPPASGAVIMHLEITDRAKAQLALRRTAKLLLAVTSGIPDQVFIKDQEGRYLLCNEAFSRFVGRSSQEMVGQNNVDLFGDSGHKLAENDRAVMASGSSIATEDLLPGVEGTRTFSVNKFPYRDESGKVIGVIGISRDITERKLTERKLRESQELLSMAGRLAQVGSWVVDLPSNRVQWTEVLAKIHGEPLGFSPTVEQAINYYAPEHRHGITKAFSQCAENGTPFDVEYEIVTAKGHRVWVRAIGEAVRDERGNICRVQGALQDLTDRVRAERKSQQLADRLTNILGSITDAFFTLDRQWRFGFVNDEAARLLGDSCEQLIGRNIWDATHGQLGTEIERGICEAMVSGVAGQFEAYFGPWQKWLVVSCYPAESGLSISLRDVTQQRNDRVALSNLNADLEARVAARTEELTLAREDAEQANRAKSAFLATMSHEIRTPMNGVIGMIDVLEQTNLIPSQADVVSTVRESAYALLQIVDDVLDFSKIEAGHFQIDLDEFSIRSVIERVHATLDHLASSKQVTLTRQIDAALPERVLGDGPRLRQILVNLVGNAIKFSSSALRQGKVEVRATRLQSVDGSCAVEFEVLDNGIGMEVETLDRLFTPFTQADDSTTKRFGGTGLGLSISNRLVDLMGGSISVTSALGNGSCFVVRLSFQIPDVGAGAHKPGPLDDDEHVILMPDVGSPDSLPMSLNDFDRVPVRRPILVAEDNEVNQKVIQKQLALLGYEVHIAPDGHRAREMAQHVEYSLLLTDLHMPLLDGYALAAALREGERPGHRLPIIALTANAAKEEARRCKDVGMDDYMTKPLQLSSLHAMLVKWMPPDAQPSPLRPLQLDRFRRSSTAERTSVPAVAPSVNLQTLFGLVGTDPHVVSDLLDTFRSSAARARADILGGVVTGDFNAVSAAGHTLRTGAGSIGALRLEEACNNLELFVEGAKNGQIKVLAQRFDIALAEVYQFLDARQS